MQLSENQPKSISARISTKEQYTNIYTHTEKDIKDAAPECSLPRLVFTPIANSFIPIQ